MKKLVPAALALALALGLAGCGGAGAQSDAAGTQAGSDYEAIVEKGEMVIGYTVYEPMNYTDENGNFVGFDTELATSVCELLGVEPKFVEINWDTKFIELEAGSIDAVWNGMTLTDEIRQNQACSEPYAMNAQVIVMKADNTYTGTASLAGGSIAVELGSAGADVVAQDENLAQADVVGKSVQTECLMEVEAGTANAAVLDLTLARAMTGEGTDYADLVIVDELNSEEYGVAFRKGSDLAEQVNNAFKGLVATGRMNELSERYGVALADGMLG